MRANINLMKIIRTNKNVISAIPTIITHKFILDINNAWDYDFNEYKIQDIPRYSLLLLDKEQNIVEGLLTITEREAPQNVFCSIDGGYLDLEGVIQLEIDCIDIPQKWITDSIIETIFCWLQHHLRTYLSEKNVIVWFYYKNYYMCPVSHKVKAKQYEHFYTKMKEYVMPLLK